MATIWVSAAVSAETRDALNAIAEEKLVSRSDVIRWAIDDLIRRKGQRFFVPSCTENGSNEPNSDQDTLSEPASTN